MIKQTKHPDYRLYGAMIIFFIFTLLGSVASLEVYPANPNQVVISTVVLLCSIFGIIYFTKVTTEVANGITHDAK